MSRTRSAADEYPVSSRPLGDVNNVRVMPSCSARAFMASTNASTEPETCSASATAASLADWSSRAYSSSSTRIRSPAIRPRPEMPAIWPLAAPSLTVTTSVRSARSTTRSAVMIFVTLAIGRRSLRWRSKSTWPVSRSASTADAAWISGTSVEVDGVRSVEGNGDRLTCPPGWMTGVGGGGCNVGVCARAAPNERSRSEISAQMSAHGKSQRDSARAGRRVTSGAGEGWCAAAPASACAMPWRARRGRPSHPDGRRGSADGAGASRSTRRSRPPAPRSACTS